MALAVADSNVARRMLGLTLEAMREKEAISREAAADAIGLARSTLWKIETGQNARLNPVLMKHLCGLYRATTKETQVVLELVKETKATGWWQAFADDAIPKEFGLFVGLEDAAQQITSYQTALLPGLLHTADYRRTLIWAEFPNKPTDEVERMLEVGMRRQDRLTSKGKPLAMDVFIDESALRRITGSASIMACQLHHLAEVGVLPNVSIRVVPLTAGTYRGLIVGMFVILDFPLHPKAELTMPPVVYVQGFLGDLYLEQRDEVRQYREVCADVERLALDEAKSRALILRIAKECVV
ncbi:DNA-binding XRE family transcriptional regulator [Nocardia transvalensis]|uniref:DNA-binding XRE family transcriptional regulator n=1 Tax=Nocardia transvalensis TaxID=37333 RepID=A0A7W9PL72_9NOCA|nr:helix-turn-helix transcriptional regulator [Nocardia transvalensis]MBB5918234.1 DNA-binding XRE family transcriptional regulator [Nocardia transvalensis]